MSIWLRFLLPLDFRQPFSTAWVCVRECPNELLIDSKALRSFVKNHHYSPCANLETGEKASPTDSSAAGPCPNLPLLPRFEARVLFSFLSIPILNRCLPANIKELSESAAKDLLSFFKSFAVSKALVDDLIHAAPTLAKTLALSVRKLLLSCPLTKQSFQLLEFFSFQSSRQWSSTSFILLRLDLSSV